MKSHYLLAAALALGVGAAGCKKDNPDPDGLVAATQEGKNTGDFLLNGAAFKPRPSIGSPGSKPVGAIIFPGRSSRSWDVKILFYRMENENASAGLNLILYGMTGPGQYALQQTVNPLVVPGSNQRYAAFTQIFPKPERDYVTGPTARGNVIITRFDTVAQIISGTFEAKFKEFNGRDSLQVTKGRFDLKF